MAFAMIGGIIVGTLLTLLFVPALYVAWFRVVTTDGIKDKAGCDHRRSTAAR